MQITQLYKYYLKGVFYSTLAVLAACHNTEHTIIKYVAPGTFSTPDERRQLFEALGVVYVSEPQFTKHPKLAQISPEDYSGYKDNKEEHQQITKKYGAQIAQKYMAPVSIKYISEEVGYGLYANEDFKAGDFIGEYAGQVVHGRVKDATWSWSYPIRAKANSTLAGNVYSMDSKKYGNELRFVNDDEGPNLVVKFVFQGSCWHIIYVAKKDISKEEQLLISYGDNYWKTRKKINF